VYDRRNAAGSSLAVSTGRLVHGVERDAGRSLSGGALVILRRVVSKSLPWVIVPHYEFLPRWLVIGFIFVAMDACNWSAHLANHKVRMLWRFHELHHSQEDMSVLTVFRTHP